MNFRTERDTLGPIEVPAHRLWGAQTQRSLAPFRHFRRAPAAGDPPGAGVGQAASATVNHALGLLDARQDRPSWPRRDEVIDGLHAQEFPLVVWQTGSGTQTNMNVNEVLANRASELLGGGAARTARCTPTMT
jgi:fumarate hydratase class II